MDGDEAEETEQPAQGSTRPRRFAKACDICFKRKVKCEGGTPPCLQCRSRGQACTFTRAEADLSKPRRAGRQLKVVNARLQHVESLLAEARQREQQAVSNEQTKRLQVSTSHEYSTGDTPSIEHRNYALKVSANIEGDILAQPIPHELLMVFELYCDIWHRFFPYFNTMALITSVLQPRSRTAEETDLIRVCVRAVLSITLRMAALSPTRDADFDCDHEADRQLDLALSDSGKVVAANPSMLSVQTLLSLSVSMALSAAYNPTRASVMLAATFQAAKCIGMGDEDDQMGTPAEHRHRQILFWYLHILDQELSMRSGTSPILTAVSLILVEETKLSIGTRRIDSLDEKYSIDIFAARCELARIQMRIWTWRDSLGKGIERFAPSTMADEFNETLDRWCTKYLPSVEEMVAELWPATIYVHLARLYQAHFRTLLWFRSPGYSDLRAVENWLQEHRGQLSSQLMAIRRHSGPATSITACTQDFLTVVASVGTNLPAWLHETLPETARGCLIMYQAVIHTEDTVLAEQKLNITNSWLELLTSLVSLHNGDELALAIRVLKQLRDLASHSLTQR